MYQELLNNESLPSFLFQIDGDLAREYRAKGCWACGAVVHQANYPRKVRGGPWRLDETQDLRFSFCCSAEGCRRRLTPPSVRFLDRHIYLSVVVMLAGLLMQGPAAWRVCHLSAKLGVSRRTLVRWRQWWQTRLVQTRTWRLIQGRILAPVNTGLPAAVLDLMTGVTAADRVVALLKLLAPLAASFAISEGRSSPAQVAR